MRFVVTELEGYPASFAGTNAKLGLSCMVLDTLACYRVVAMYRTENLIAHARSVPPATVRQLAADHASRLESECA